MKELPRFSYSRLSTFIQCPMKYDLKYLQGNYNQSEAIHLDLGNILHKTLEIKHRNTIDGKENNLEELRHIAINGIAEDTDKDKGNFINGITKIKDKYGEEIFAAVDPKSELSYDEKLDLFFYYLENDDIGDWKPFAVEQSFEFNFQDRVIFTGFIDRIDINEDGDFRVVDYKSSNKVFADKDLVTPLQMVIYALAVEDMFGKVPIEYQYDMVLLGQKQDACTKGFYDRGVKKINKVLDEIEWCEMTGQYKPKPTPLCHWCEFSDTNPRAEWFSKNLCEYYSLWTPEHKTFAKNKEYN